MRRRQSHHSYVRPSQQRHAPQAARYRLAVAVMALFTCVCVGVILIPSNSILEKILPFVAASLSLVLNYYFGRTGN